MIRHAGWIGWAAGLLLSACSTTGAVRSDAAPAATPPVGAVPSYLTTDKGCAVVAGGGIGSAFADPTLTSFWHRVNGEITSQLHDRLAQDHYRVVKLVVPSVDAPINEQVVMHTLVVNRCNRLIQVSHTIAEDANGKFFRFDVAAMRMQPRSGGGVTAAGGTDVTTVGEFKREYRFPRTEAAFNSFQTGQFAGTVLRDLEQSGALEALR